MPHADEGRLHALADGEIASLDPGEARRLALHLEECAECRARLHEARLLRERAREILGESGPALRTAPEWEVVAGRASGGAAGRRRRVRPALVTAWAASLVLALGLGWVARERLAAPADEVAMVTSDRREAAAAPDADLPEAGTGAAGAATAAPAAPPPPPPPATAQARSAAPGPADLADASRRLGAPVLTVPDLPVVGVSVADEAGEPVVRVVQRLPSGDLLRLEQRRGRSGRAAAANAPEGAGSLVVVSGELEVTATAPLPVDSLRALLGRLR